MPFTSHNHIQIDFSIEQNAANFIAGLDHWQALDLVTSDPIQVKVTRRKGDPDALQVNFRASLRQPHLLKGLAAWQELGLFDDVQIQGRVWVFSSHPALIKGLETWAQLGLLSTTALLELGRTHLTCPVPVVSRPSPRLARAHVPAAHTAHHTSPAGPTVAPRSFRSRRPSLPVRSFRSLMAELSVIWLLLLGVVLVIFSSSVLVANQWNRFSPGWAVWHFVVLYPGLWGRGDLDECSR